MIYAEWLWVAQMSCAINKCRHNNEIFITLICVQGCPLVNTHVPLNSGSYNSCIEKRSTPARRLPCEPLSDSV